MNGKNYHVITIFPPFFTSAVCRLPFSTRRGLFSRSKNNASVYRKFFNRFTTFTDLCLGLMLFYWLTVSLCTNRKKTLRESELTLKCLQLSLLPFFTFTWNLNRKMSRKSRPTGSGNLTFAVCCKRESKSF